MMEKYIKIYHKRNAQFGCLCAFLAFVPLFIVSLFYDIIPEDTWISFIPFAFAAMYVAIASLNTIRFKKLIAEQEQMYHIQFQDDNVEHLETTLYLSDGWLIWAGSCAFYKNHIKSIRSVHRFGRAGSSSQVTIKTVDDKKHTVWCLSASNVKKLKQWLKS